MTLRLKTPCDYAGCRRAVRGRFCEVHRHLASRRPSERRRGTANQRGYDRRWRKRRQACFAW